MKKFKLNISDRGLKILILDIVALLVLVLGLVYIVSSCTSSAPAVNSSSIAPVSVPQLPSAASVASSLGCGQYQEADMSGAHIYVIDAGVCWIGSTKYAIDTFTSKTVRDEWIKAAGMLGIIVLKQNDTSVFYKASDQTHDNK